MNLVELANLVLNGLNEGLTIALAAVAMTLVFGVGRFTNAATGDLMAFGAYGVLFAGAVPGMPFAAALVCGVAATALLALATHRLVFMRLQGRAGAISLLASIGIALLIRGFLIFVAGHEQRTYDLPLVRGINVFQSGFVVQPTDLYIMAAASTVIIAIFGMLGWTSLGRRMRAVADNPVLAQASGIRRERVLMHLWLMAGAVCALAGVFIGLRSVITPDFGFEILLPVFSAAVLGGLGNPVGAVFGGVLIGVGQELSVPIVGASYKLAIGFLVLIVMLLLRPHGILGRAGVVR